MKNKFLLFVIFMLAFSSVEFAQVKVSTKKVRYKRTSKDVSDYKKTFTIEYPIISGANAKKIQTILSYETNFDFNLKEQIKGEDYWLDSCSYKVNFNKNDVLDVSLFMEGSGAYPSISTKYVVVNSKTGTRVKPADVFTNQSGLIALLKKYQQSEIKRESARLKKEEPDFDASEYFDNATYKEENLSDFTISQKGITFHYDYGFPHVALALQPDGKYFISWTILKPYIKSSGLFSQFADNL